MGGPSGLCTVYKAGNHRTDPKGPKAKAAKLGAAPAARPPLKRQAWRLRSARTSGSPYCRGVHQAACLYVHVYKRTCICLHVYSYTYVCVHVCVCVCACMYVFVYAIYIYTYIHIHTYTYIYIHIHTYICIRIYRSTHVSSLCGCASTPSALAG